MNDFRKLLANFPISEEEQQIPFAPAQPIMPDNLNEASQEEALNQAIVQPQAPARAPAQDVTAKTLDKTVTTTSGTAPSSQPQESPETKLEELMKKLQDQRNLEREDAASRKFKADIFKIIGDNVGGLIGGAQAMNTGAAVNPIKTQGYDVGDLVAGVDKKFAGDQEALLNQYKMMVAARDRADTNKFRDEQLKINKQELAIKQQLANQKNGGKPTKFDEETQKLQAKNFATTQANLNNVTKNIEAIDDALKSQLDYTKNTLGGTGPMATGFGLRKYTDQDTQNLEAKFRNINLKNMVNTFSGMSKAVDTDAERRAWESTQADLKNDDSVNVSILLGSKSSLLKDRAVAQAQQEWVKNYGNLNGFEESNPILQGKVTTVVSPNGEMRLIPKEQLQEAKKAGFSDLDGYAKTLIGSTKKRSKGPSSQNLATPGSPVPVDTSVKPVTPLEDKITSFMKKNNISDRNEAIAILKQAGKL